MHGRRMLLAAAAALVLASAALYFAHYLLFHDSHHIFVYLVGDIAFVPIEVLLVALVIERMLHHHEKRLLMQKLNMLIGAFFSEVGTPLLGDITPCIRDSDAVRANLGAAAQWTPVDFKRADGFARTFDYQVDAGSVELDRLRESLNARRDFLVLLLANPSLLEHDRFTNLLRAVFHLTEELAARGSLDTLPETDRAHLAGDIKRVYSLLAREWILYCGHLKRSFPFIFSVVARTHPLQPEPNATVTE